MNEVSLVCPTKSGFENSTDRSSNDDSIFKNDQDYLEQYSAICSLFTERYDLSQDLAGGGRRRNGITREMEELNALRIPKLTQSIRVQEWLFWEKVARSLEAGRRFIVEDLARHYKLGHFEKRVFLLFLCRAFSGKEDLCLSLAAILSMLDLEDSVVGRMKQLNCFDKEKPLLSACILKGDRILGCGYELNPVFIEVVSKRLCGESAEWPSQQKASASRVACDDNLILAPDRHWEHIVLDPETKEKVEFFLEVYKSKRLQELGVDKTIKNSKGLTFLFYGPPGTGKSMLAEAIATNVGKKLLVAETSKIFSMWLGETDKNISSLFKKASDDDLVLLFDEADSLVHSRDMASGNSRLRFVNLMLTELERFNGIAILTTNMDQILDKALERRIALKIEFKLPNPEKRAQIWKRHIPPAFSLSSDVNFDELAKVYEFAGGNIKNAVLNSLRRIIFRKEQAFRMDDLVFGAEIERQGMYSGGNGRKVVGFNMGG